MENIIDYIKNGRRKIARVLDFLSVQLEKLHSDEEVNYLALLDAVNFIDAYPNSILIPKEDELLDEFTEKYNFFGFNVLVNQYRAENIELKTLTKSLREYIQAAMDGVVFKKELFEEQLDTCIEREREHIDTEVNTILPLLSLMLAQRQIKKLSKSFNLEFNTNNEVDNFVVTDEIYQITKDDNMQQVV